MKESLIFSRKFVLVGKYHFLVSAKLFSEKGISTGQPKIIDFLYENDGVIQNIIAEKCYIRPATATSLLTTMEEQGLIRRERDLNDKRIFKVFLTDEGRNLKKEVDDVFNQLDTIILKNFNDNEKEQLGNLMNKIITNLGGELE